MLKQLYNKLTFMFNFLNPPAEKSDTPMNVSYNPMVALLFDIKAVIMSCCENEGKRLTLRLVGTALVDVLRNPCVIHITCLLQLRCAFLMHDPFAYKSGKQHLLLILEFMFDAR